MHLAGPQESHNSTAHQGSKNSDATLLTNSSVHDALDSLKDGSSQETVPEWRPGSGNLAGEIKCLVRDAENRTNYSKRLQRTSHSRFIRKGAKEWEGQQRVLFPVFSRAAQRGRRGGGNG